MEGLDRGLTRLLSLPTYKVSFDIFQGPENLSYGGVHVARFLNFGTSLKLTGLRTNDTAHPQGVFAHFWKWFTWNDAQPMTLTYDGHDVVEHPVDMNVYATPIMVDLAYVEGC